MAADGGGDRDNEGGPLESIGKALDPYAKHLPKGALIGAGGVALLVAFHRVIPADLSADEHNFIDWAIGIGIVACIVAVVMSVFRQK